MTLDKDKKILIVGLGLIGGSYAAALSQNGWEVGAIDPDPQAIAFAEKAGFIRHGRTEPEAEYVGKFDIVVFALYPHVLLEWLEKYGPWLRDGALATDVTGVKSGVVERAQALLFPRVEFIGAHPMAGREVSGVENARADLFRGANYIVTPTAANTEEAIACCETLGRTLGARNISRLTPKEHDEMIGFLSQLTLHRRGADDLQRVPPSGGLYGRFIPGLDPHCEDQRKHVDRTVPVESGGAAEPDGFIYRPLCQAAGRAGTGRRGDREEHDAPFYRAQTLF